MLRLAMATSEDNMTGHLNDVNLLTSLRRPVILGPRGGNMTTYRAFEVSGERQFRLVTRELRQPDPGHVRLRVESCGVCNTDVLAVEGMRADPGSPVVPGHEIVGVIDAVGEGVRGWRV